MKVECYFHRENGTLQLSLYGETAVEHAFLLMMKENPGTPMAFCEPPDYWPRIVIPIRKKQEDK